MRKKSKTIKFFIGFLVVCLLVFVAGYVILSQSPFGGAVSGERLERVQANAQYRGDAFVNVEPQAPFELSNVGTFISESFFYDEIRVPPSDIPVISVDSNALQLAQEPILKAFWIGHASVYVEIDGIRVLIDPVFSEYASPFDIGPKRFHPPPIALEDLPKIDAVVISHDHYDHLDLKTITHLAKNGTLFFVPLGVGAHLEVWRIPSGQIKEFEWWQSEMVGNVKIISTPSRHYSGRGLGDYKATLWSSWSVIGPQHRFFYSGDTGYSTLFKEIGKRFGPFDIGFIKVGAYGPGQGWIDIHMDPEHAVKVHQDIQGKRMFPVHWGTFNLGYHDWDEPIKRTIAAAEKEQIDLVTPQIGEMVWANQSFDSKSWWEQVK